MKVLHIVKAANVAAWVLEQAEVLSSLGVEVHVAMPRLAGHAIPPMWAGAPVVLHFLETDMPVRQPWRVGSVLYAFRRMVHRLRPDLIHTHHVSTTLLARWALGAEHPIPRFYQVAGPLHLEYPPYRDVEVRSAGSADYWGGSCKDILKRYRAVGVREERLFLTYSGRSFEQARPQKGQLRAMVGASEDDLVVGNINLFYKPKRYLGHDLGLKSHETIFAALALAMKQEPRIRGVFVGGAVNEGALAYEQFLREEGRRLCGERIHFTGRQPSALAPALWVDFDLGVHLSLSESCGGVVEPLLWGVPVVSQRTGGIPDVVFPERTGWLVEDHRDIESLAEKILYALSHREEGAAMARCGQALVPVMFGIKRTAAELHRIYRFILGEEAERPPAFDSAAFVEEYWSKKQKEEGACG
jgi:glycosyltransferase involved in cell wall biosynthesis